ncbi:MAG: hypothetical protein P4L68_10660 [Methylovirgula sp.]|nr:hypothetical protein [Methylovirgula sp.]
MADPEPGEETGAVPSKPDFSANAVRREAAVIAGTAEDLTPQESHQEAPHETAEPSQPVAEAALAFGEGEPAPAAEASEPSEPAPEDAASEPPSSETPPREVETKTRRGGILAPALLSLIIGGAAGFGGAFALRHLDNTDAEIDALRVQLAHLEMQQPDLARQDAQNEALANAQTALAKRLATAEAAANANADALTALRAEVEKLAARKPAAAGGAAPDLGPLTQQVAALQDKLTALTTQVGDLSGSLAAQKSQVTATQNLVAQTAAAHADDTAIALIAGSLLRKAEAGLPFTDDLSALAAHGADKTALASLAPNAQSGVATSGALVAQFAAETAAILATAPAPHATGFLDRLLKDAEGLIRIRKVGEASGDSLAARVARIQKALDAGAVETAYQQWTALPAAAQQKSQDFGTAAKRRLDTIAAARAIEAAALANLGKAKS